VPTFRPDYLKYAFDFGWKDKLAPRLGAAYDLWGDGRAKIFGSWGRYYDWTKYELVRATFGAEAWCQYYRALDTTNLGSISLSSMPGRDLWITPGTCRDRRVPSFADTIDPATKPMSQDSVSAGLEYQFGASRVLTVHYIHNNLRDTIEDIGFLDSTGNEGYLIGNPGRGQTQYQFPSGKTPAGQPTPLVTRRYDALEVGINRRYSSRIFWSVNYTLSRLWGNYSGIGSSDEITSPATGNTAATSQQQTGSIARPGANDSRAWDLDELLWDAHGHLDVVGRLATDRPHVVKAYGSLQAPFGTQFGALFYGGSGTPADDLRDEHQYIGRCRIDGRGPRRHGPYAGSHADRPPRQPRARSCGSEESSIRAKCAESLQPENCQARLERPEPRIRCRRPAAVSSG
jgi:hypothetical protein